MYTAGCVFRAEGWEKEIPNDEIHPLTSGRHPSTGQKILDAPRDAKVWRSGIEIEQDRTEQQPGRRVTESGPGLR